jgi:UDP-glucose 4-epimerase
MALMDEPAAIGEVINIGSTEEVSIDALAQRVKSLAKSSSRIERIPYSEAYEAGFEDMARRVPDISKIQQMIGFQARRNLDQILVDVIDHERTRNDRGAPAPHASRVDHSRLARVG